MIFIRGVDRSSFGPVDRSGPWVFVAVWSLGQALIGCGLKLHQAGAEQVYCSDGSSGREKTLDSIGSL